MVSAPATGGGYTFGRSQVWLGNVLIAEGTSQMMLLPIEDQARRINHR